MASNPYVLKDDEERRKAALIESGMDPELLEEAEEDALLPVAPMPAEAPTHSSKSDRVREAIYAAGTRQALGPDFFRQPAKDAAAAEQREILKQRVLAQWSKRQAEAEALKRKFNPASEESKIGVALWESSPEGQRIMENMRANHPELAAKVSAGHIPEWKVALPHEQRTAAPAQKAAAAVEAAPALEGAKGEETRKTLGAKQAGDKDLQAQKDAEAYRRAQLLAQGKKDVLGARKEEKDLMLEIPGWKRRGDVTVKPEVAEKLRERVAGKDRIVAGTSTMAQLMDKNPGAFRTGVWQTMPEISGPMEVAFNSIKMGVKQNEALGALVGGDFAIIEEAANDPRPWKEVLKSLLGISNLRAKLDAYPKLVKNLTANELNLRGYDPDDGKAPAAPKAPPTGDPKPATVRMRDPKGVLYEMDESEVEMALKKNWTKA